jgi:regulator of RNase E activity RraB
MEKDGFGSFLFGPDDDDDDDDDDSKEIHERT